MQRCKYLAILSVACLFTSTAQAADMFYSVPFHHVEVKAASKIYVDYNFNPHKQILVCQDVTVDSGAITSVEWEYKDATRKIPLPVTLNDNVKFQGYEADPEGRLTITNEFGSMSKDGSIFVSCDYRNMK